MCVLYCQAKRQVGRTMCVCNASSYTHSSKNNSGLTMGEKSCCTFHLLWIYSTLTRNSLISSLYITIVIVNQVKAFQSISPTSFIYIPHAGTMALKTTSLSPILFKSATTTKLIPPRTSIPNTTWSNKVWNKLLLIGKWHSSRHPCYSVTCCSTFVNNNMSSPQQVEMESSSYNFVHHPSQ